MTREEFLAEYHSPYTDWASDAESLDIVEPSEAKIRQGWVIEQPMHAYFNWHMNRADRRLKALEAKVAWLEKCLADKIAEN